MDIFKLGDKIFALLEVFGFWNNSDIPGSLQCLDSHRSVSRAEVPWQSLRVLSRSF